MAKLFNRLLTFIALGIAAVIGGMTVLQAISSHPDLAPMLASSPPPATSEVAPASVTDALATIESATTLQAPAQTGNAPEDQGQTASKAVTSGTVDGVAALDARDIPALARAIAAELARQDFVADEVKRNPEIVAEALVLWSRAQQGDAPEIKTEAIDPALLLHVLDGTSGVYVGPADAVFTAVEFIDVNCPHCRNSIPHALAWIDQNPGVRILFRELPVIARQSSDAARVAIALGQQGLYRAWLEEIAAWKGGVVDGAVARDIARRLGADMERLEAGAAHADTQTAIADNLELGAALNIDGTPAWVVGSSLLIGSTSLEWLTDFAAQHGAPLPHTSLGASDMPAAAPAIAE